MLKGAMLLRMWADHPYRATRDLDLLRRGEGAAESIRADLETICRTEVAPDGVAFDPRSIRLEAIRREDEYAGRNSRIRDFFDVHHLAEHRGFEGAILLESIRRTFERRGTPIPTEEPIALTSASWDDPAREVQIRAFARRSGIRVSRDVASDVLRVLRTFLLPVLFEIDRGGQELEAWPPVGPWRRRGD